MKRIMNLNKWILLAILATVSLTFASCGSDDDDNDNKGSDDLASAMVGTYTGDVTAVGKYSGTATLKITRTGKNSIKGEFTSPDVLASMPALESDLQSVGDNEIWGTTPTIVNVLYYRKQQDLTFQSTRTAYMFSFQGSKK